MAPAEQSNRLLPLLYLIYLYPRANRGEVIVRRFSSEVPLDLQGAFTVRYSVKFTHKPLFSLYWTSLRFPR